MTNKLRSVIEELYNNSTTMTVDPDSPRHRKALEKLYGCPIKITLTPSNN